MLGTLLSCGLFTHLVLYIDKYFIIYYIILIQREIQEGIYLSSTLGSTK